MLTAPDGLRSRLTGLHGYDTAAALEAVEGTAFGSPALVPALDGVTKDGWTVSLAVLGDGDDPVDVHVEVDVDRVAIVWPDDERFTVTSRDPQE